MTAVGLYRGMVSAAAFVIDVGVLGEVESRRRVLELWTPGVQVLNVPGAGWLVVLPQPAETRLEYSPGMALLSSRGGLAAPGLTGEPSTIILPLAGTIMRIALDSLAPVPMSDWLDTTTFAIHQLTSLDRPSEPATILDESASPEPDLRSLAHIRRAKNRKPGRIGGWSIRRWLVTLLVLAIIITLIGLAFGWGNHHSPSSSRPGTSVVPTTPSPTPPTAIPTGVQTPTIPPFDSVTPFVLPAPVDSQPGSYFPGMVGLIVIALFLTRAAAGVKRRRGGARRTGNGAGGQGGRPKSRWSRLARLLMRTPASDFVSRRHERYLASLTRKFERRNWDDALRDAIKLGGGSGVGMNLRLPKRRDSLSLFRSGGAGGSVPYGPNVQAHLCALYLQAADELERAARIQESAFVRAELLNDSGAAAGVLERHGEYALAAQLAESRRHSPGLVIRLWWRAGNRQRAIDVARARGAFAAAITRLTEVDAAAAAALRAEWVRWCRNANDHLGAVEAAWPEPSLRPTVLPDIHEGMAVGGAVRARLLAYLVSEDPTAEAIADSLALLDSDDAVDNPARSQFIATLAELAGPDRAHDRRLCTAALRSMLRAPSVEGLLEAQSAQRVIRRLRVRADPVVNADLPTISPRRPPAGDAVDLSFPVEPGQMPVYDAVPLADGGMLLAHGDLGVRLVTSDGRVRARWDVPTHEFVMADHGGSVLLVTRSGDDRDLHHLDLGTRRVRRWATLRVKHVVPSFDGGVLVIVDDDGIALMDVLGEQPKIIWRELDRESEIFEIGRTPTDLTALVRSPSIVAGGAPVLALWNWQLPGMTLRLRRNVVIEPRVRAWAVTSGELITIEDGDQPALVRYKGYADPETVRLLPENATITANGNAYATSFAMEDGRVGVALTFAGRTIVNGVLPAGSNVGVRSHGDRCTLWDQDGRVAVVDATHPALLAMVRTSV
jgi:hypothetical protein